VTSMNNLRIWNVSALTSISLPDATEIQTVNITGTKIENFDFPSLRNATGIYIYGNVSRYVESRVEMTRIYYSPASQH
jgi:hypothetical protein